MLPDRAVAVRAAVCKVATEHTKAHRCCALPLQPSLPQRHPADVLCAPNGKESRAADLKKGPCAAQSSHRDRRASSGSCHTSHAET